jgi:tetratricopeptide (TPR) repeat protein
MARKPADLPDSYDPVEIALDAQRGDPAPDSPARTLLVNQNRLILMQIASERVGMVLKGLMGLGGVAAATALGFMVWDAAHDHSLVIEAFSTPPDLAAQGLTGQVLATELLDQVAALDDKTQSLRSSASYASSWSGDAKVEIPSTGISVGELQRFLRAWLGHQTRISGELVRTPAKDGKPTGLTLTVRAGSAAGEKVSSVTGDVDELLAAAAKTLYRQSQPYRYFIYATRVGNLPDAQAVLMKQTLSDDRNERAWAWSGLASSRRGTDPAGGQADARRALAERPDFAPALGNLGLAEESADHPEAALAFLRRAVPLFGSSRDLEPRIARFNQVNARFHLDNLACDYRAAGMDIDTIDALNQALGDSDVTATGLQKAELLVRLHEPLAAERMFPAGILARAPFPTRDVWILDRLEREDWQGAIAAAGPLIGGTLKMDPFERVYWPRITLPNVALAYAMAGDFAAARALIAQAPVDGYTTMIIQGRIAALSGDAAGADRWFGQAVMSAPSIARAYVAWGRVLLARGQADAALARFAQAAAKAPRYADPLTGWGQALLSKGDARAAEAKFRAADAIAPRWGLNHLLWGDALARLHRPAEARAQWLAARGMDLTAASRADVERRLAGH